MRSSHTLWDELKTELLYMGLTPGQTRQAAGPIAEDNRRSVAYWATFSALFWIMSLAMSLSSSAYAACRSVYVCALAFCGVTLIFTEYVLKRLPRLLTPVMYLFELSFLGAGIGIALCQPDVRTVTMIVFACIAPTAFIDSSLVDLLLQALTILVFALFGRDILAPAVYSWSLTNLLIFSVAGFLIGHVINKARFERYVYAESAKRLAEIQTRYAYYDQLTGLKNRRAYTEALDRLAKTPPEALCVIMADLNGLKETNDTRGHGAGDALIAGAAACLREAFGNTDGIYRIGGDEFCVLLPCTAEEAEACLARLGKISAGWKGPGIDGVSIACGLASTRERGDLHFLTTQADRRMYEQKREYHRLHP